MVGLMISQKKEKELGQSWIQKERVPGPSAKINTRHSILTT